MNLVGGFVRVHLSSVGQQELGMILKADTPLEAFVVSQDSVGLWVTTDTESQAPEVVLLKWEHFSTVSFEFRPTTPMERGPAGFRP